MVEPGRKVISGIVTGSPPVRSTYKVPYDRVKVMLELGVATVLLVLASPIVGTEQEFSSSYEHLEGDTTGVVDPDVSFEAYF